ncbi:hypothetical protein Hden_1215 [Hyphomicrobium denitrificans ATCC 51888]|uniref:Uncharacterized protein n=1 Tax=Hyphomicrobium denitrificans (strain ATCC 51888 / DSM 1869 / NCIMB 11706 / TK 0415) TaxID=582899 RepID=D8JWB4_HYPDA|nr:hypothetical protein [Hyphomicrobium denitrificans]ADJ23027.1 hypothetical protein Hden_1215 [Hyphomicrobium denitrificans ATCC 51888]
MANRQIINTASPIARGRISAPLNLKTAPVGSGPLALPTANPTPNVSMTAKGGFLIQTGTETLRSAQAAGMPTAPVAASMASLRRMAKAGYLGSGAGVQNMARKAEASMVGGAGIEIIIDTRDILKISEGLAAAGIILAEGHAILSKAINDGARKYNTTIKRKLQAWTGLRDQARIVRAISTVYSTPATLAAVIRVRDRFVRITADYFGASWSRANPGAVHSAWNRRQLAVHAFMIPGKAPVFKRVGSSKYPIAPIWGPALPREIDRHRGEVEAEVNAIVRTRVLATGERLLAMAVARAARR